MKYRLQTAAALLGAIVFILGIARWFVATEFVTKAEATQCHDSQQLRIVDIEKKNAVFETKLDNLSVSSQRIEAVQVEILRELRKK